MDLTTAMLADAAAVLDGKLYIHGGGWDRLNTATAPVTHPSMSLVLVFRLEQHEALKDIPVNFVLADEDRHNEIIRGQVNMRVGIPPLVTRGEPIQNPFTVTLQGIQFPKLGRYTFLIESGETELARLPITVSSPPAAGA
jgi:hypothetical protein